MQIMQGDSYDIPFTISTQSGLCNIDDFEDIELMVGTLIKKLSDGQISYDEETQQFSFSVSQQETLLLPSAPQRVQIRCKFSNEYVVGKVLDNATITLSISKEVL